MELGVGRIALPFLIIVGGAVKGSCGGVGHSGLDILLVVLLGSVHLLVEAFSRGCTRATVMQTRHSLRVILVFTGGFESVLQLSTVLRARDMGRTCHRSSVRRLGSFGRSGLTTGERHGGSVGDSSLFSLQLQKGGLRLGQYGEIVVRVTIAFGLGSLQTLQPKG